MSKFFNTVCSKLLFSLPKQFSSSCQFYNFAQNSSSPSLLPPPRNLDTKCCLLLLVFEKESPPSFLAFPCEDCRDRSLSPTVLSVDEKQISWMLKKQVGCLLFRADGICISLMIPDLVEDLVLLEEHAFRSLTNWFGVGCKWSNCYCCAMTMPRMMTMMMKLKLLILLMTLNFAEFLRFFLYVRQLFQNSGRNCCQPHFPHASSCLIRH